VIFSPKSGADETAKYVANLAQYVFCLVLTLQCGKEFGENLERIAVSQM
jgi:hypothetical protein